MATKGETQPMMQRTFASRRERGVTLVELVIALAVAGVLLAGLVLVSRQSLTAYRHGSEAATLQQDTRIGHDRMMRELRLAGMNPCRYAPPPSKALGVTATSSTSVTVTYYPATDNCQPPVNFADFREVTYSYDAANKRLLRQQGTASAAPLTDEKVITVAFTYFECDGTTPPTALRQIARIRVGLDLQATVDGSPYLRSLVSDLRLRNVACAGTNGL